MVYVQPGVLHRHAGHVVVSNPKHLELKGQCRIDVAVDRVFSVVQVLSEGEVFRKLAC